MDPSKTVEELGIKVGSKVRYGGQDLIVREITGELLLVSAEQSPESAQYAPVVEVESVASEEPKPDKPKKKGTGEDRS